MLCCFGMQNEHAVDKWAEQEFGQALLGDQRRTARAVAMAKAIAAHPSGLLTQVFAKSDEREAAFRFVRNDDISPSALMDAAHSRTALRCAEHPFVFVAVDQTDLSIVDNQRTKGLGDTGTAGSRGSGLQVVNSLAVSPDGVPLGLLSQQYWTRLVGKRKLVESRRKRPPEEKETGHWLAALSQSQARLASVSTECLPWFQLDRGADAWPVHLFAQKLDGYLTVRASWNRRLWRAPREPQRYLWGHVEEQTPMGTHLLHIPREPGRPARQALLTVRATPVELDLVDHQKQRHHKTPLWAVLAHEDQPPPGIEAVRWLLLTTHPVHSKDDALRVLGGYTQRWRVEEFHRTWKSGACQIERTQLRSKENILRWAVLLSSVAVRVERLAKLSRTQPDLPATTELDEAEIEAARLSTQRKPSKAGQVPTIGEVTLWIAELGGYTGKSSGGPPGIIVLTRGLQRIELLAVHLRRTAEHPPDL